MSDQRFIIEPEDLDKIFHRWKYRDRLDERKFPMRYQKNYRDQRFEDWLWEQGGSVVQKNGKRYLVFSEYDRGIEFKLTTLYGV